MAVAVWYHHALRAPVSPGRVIWLAVGPPLERVMRQAVNRRTDSHLEALRPHTASQCQIIPFQPKRPETFASAPVQPTELRSPLMRT